MPIPRLAPLKRKIMTVNSLGLHFLENLTFEELFCSFLPHVEKPRDF